jgi:hypothetical protein
MRTSRFSLVAALCSIVTAMPLADDDVVHPLTGFYYGTATIASPASIGIVDLAFYLEITGDAITHGKSYVDLDKTLLFPVAPEQIDGQDVGPWVSGTFTPGFFQLTSDDFESEVAGKTVRRRIELRDAQVTQGGASITGNYVETVVGLIDPESGQAPETRAITITGRFVLARPMPTTAVAGVDTNGDGCLDLSEVRAGGTDPAAVDFTDLSAALDLFYNPLPNLRVGDPPGPDCANAVLRLQQALREYQDAQQ